MRRALGATRPACLAKRKQSVSRLCSPTTGRHAGAGCIASATGRPLRPGDVARRRIAVAQDNCPGWRISSVNKIASSAVSAVPSAPDRRSGFQTRPTPSRLGQLALHSEKGRPVPLAHDAQRGEQMGEVLSVPWLVGCVYPPVELCRHPRSLPSISTWLHWPRVQTEPPSPRCRRASRKRSTRHGNRANFGVPAAISAPPGWVAPVVLTRHRLMGRLGNLDAALQHRRYASAHSSGRCRAASGVHIQD